MTSHKTNYNILTGNEGFIYNRIDKTVNYDSHFTNHILWLLEQLVISIKYNLNSTDEILISILPKLDIFSILDMIEKLFKNIRHNKNPSEKIAFDVGQVNSDNYTGLDLLNQSRSLLKSLQNQDSLILFQKYTEQIFQKFDSVYQLYLSIILLEISKNEELFEDEEN